MSIQAPRPQDLRDAAPFRGYLLNAQSLAKLMLLAAALALSCISLGITWFLSLGLPSLHSVADYKPALATVLLDRDQQPLDVIAREFRLVIPYSQMPALLPKAFVAAEDGRFWRHTGLDAVSILRAAFNNLLAGRRSQGGSTITQQVTRALLLSREKSYSRKLTEAFLSYRLERVLSKEDILFIYLNEIYLGEGAYGVEAAALTYFGKKAHDLSLAEIALLAGLPQSPSNYSPLKQFGAARNRQRYVLNRMVEDGLISAEEARRAFAQELKFVNRWKKPLNGYVSQYLRRELEQAYTLEEIETKGLVVRTTIDARLQEAAMRSLLNGVDKVARRQPSQPAPQGALVALESASGKVLAMIGGIDFTQYPFNRAVQALRQPGSAFKPLLYAAALEQGLNANMELADSPLSVKTSDGKVWEPKNFNNSYQRKSSLRASLVHSSNVAAVRLLQKIGIEPLRHLAKDMGIRSPLQPDYTLALGSSPVSLFELSAAYTAFADQGVFHAPVAITSVRDREGQEQPWPQPLGQQTLRPENARWIHQTLAQVVRQGTGKNAAAVAGASGKTGTTDNNVDAWFIGSIPGVTAGVWIGHDRGASLGEGETGGQAAAPIWREFTLEAGQ